jgi:hypothetical protein
MQFHMGPLELTPPAPPFDEAGVAQTLRQAQFTVLMRSSFVPAPVPHSASNASPTTSSAAEEELDRWSLFDQCCREHMARRELEELFAAGEMSAFEY